MSSANHPGWGQGVDSGQPRQSLQHHGNRDSGERNLRVTEEVAQAHFLSQDRRELELLHSENKMNKTRHKIKDNATLHLNKHLL